MMIAQRAVRHCHVRLVPRTGTPLLPSCFLLRPTPRHLLRRGRQQEQLHTTSRRPQPSQLQHDDEPAQHAKQQHQRRPKQLFEIPHRLRQKVTSVEDAVSLVRNFDTVCVSGFVSQGSPEAVLQALGQRYRDTGSPHSLTLLFGGGPGDWATKGLNHLAQSSSSTGSGAAKTKNDTLTAAAAPPPMLRRAIGSHYGQVPMVAQLALDEVMEAWTLPLGSISRMIRAQSTHSPGHLTHVGLGTYVDTVGGAANASARKSPLHNQLVQKMTLSQCCSNTNDNEQQQQQELLLYRALPIQVAIIRGTTADGQGNITMEHESLLCDQRSIATAARNSGGIVIAQVKRLAASLPSRSVAVPGPLVDCVVVLDDDESDALHPMSYVELYNPALTGELRTPQDAMPHMVLDERKVTARRAFQCMKPSTVVNRGIGLPEGVASVAHEEGRLDSVTLTTEPGVLGGLPASGRSFGPAYNASALVEMNQMFDYYDGGGLDMSFLGAAQVSMHGDVNVSRMSHSRLTGPGGFIDISQSTPNLCFMTKFTARGLALDLPGDGTVRIASEGTVQKFVRNVLETTFSGDEAVRRGQSVLYVTERAVFRRSAAHKVLELIEIAPGMDVHKDIVQHMEFMPVVSPQLQTMHQSIFTTAKMNAATDSCAMFGSMEDRYTYHADDNVIFLDLSGITIARVEDIDWFKGFLVSILDPIVSSSGRVNAVINYDGFDISGSMQDVFFSATQELQDKYCKTIQRFAGKAFRRARLGQKLGIQQWNSDHFFERFDADKNGHISLEELREGMRENFHLHLTNRHLASIFDVAAKNGGSPPLVDRTVFEKVLLNVLKSEDV